LVTPDTDSPFKKEFTVRQKQVHTIIISDVHLGHHLSLAIMLMETLQEWAYEELIILGDLSHRKCKIPDSHWPLIEYLRIHREKIIYANGNHDPIGHAFVHDTLGIKIQKKHTWFVSNRKFYAIHGHQFDPHLHIFSSHMWDRVFATLCRFLKKREKWYSLLSY
jgi:UDP-2,3-diacylglucosamine pyrophosphatase LpxH